jgi:hypothetical protein
MRRRALTALLYLVQPIARLRGRMDHGLTPWRRRGSGALALPRPRSTSIWSERWAPPEGRLAIAEEGLRADGVGVELGGDFDRWDLQVRGGILGGARMRMTIEEHGSGKQLVRFRAWPRVSFLTPALCVALGGLMLGPAVDRNWEAVTVIAGVAALVATRALYESAIATGALLRALKRQERLVEYEHDLAVDLTPRRLAPLASPDAREVG